MALEPTAGACLTLLPQDRDDLLLGELLSLHVRSAPGAGHPHQMGEHRGLSNTDQATFRILV
jgi:hypothetical protein